MKTVSTTGSPPVPKYLLRWKNNASGIYEFEPFALNTPGMTDVTNTVGNLPSGTWNLGAIGNEDTLDPAGKVRRKK